MVTPLVNGLRVTTRTSLIAFSSLQLKIIGIRSKSVLTIYLKFSVDELGSCHAANVASPLRIIIDKIPN